MSQSASQYDDPKESFLNKKIYRIISFQRLADILVNKENSLVKPSMWEDPFEKWRIKKISKSVSDNNQGNKNDIKNYFAQCWTQETMQDTMWAMYSKGTDGFRIRTTVRELIESLAKYNKPCLIANVKYMYRKKIISYFKSGKSKELEQHIANFSKSRNTYEHENFLKTAEKFMIKRQGFRYEKEVRLVCYWDEQKPKSKLMRRYRICPDQLIEQIMIHPMIQESNDYEALKCALLKVGYLAANKIEWSRLHDLRE